jgi:hypothetical protein
MKRTALGILAGLAIVVAAVAVAQQPRRDETTQHGPTAAPPMIAGSDLVVVPTTFGDKTQVLTVIDPHQRVICVYRVDLATGKIALKSVRKIEWDLQITDLNNEDPLPRQIQALLQQR